MFKYSAFLVHATFLCIFFSGWTKIISRVTGWGRDYRPSLGVFKDIKRPYCVLLRLYTLMLMTARGMTGQ
jgi:hypothetical protein